MEIRIKFWEMEDSEMKDVLKLLKTIKYPRSYKSDISGLLNNVKDVEFLANYEDVIKFAKLQKSEVKD